MLRLFALSLIVGMSGFAQAKAPVSVPAAYDCRYTATPIHIDGKLDDPAWSRARWTSDFIDITGDAAKRPSLRTRMKMLWDDHYLYIAAELEEPDVHAKLTEHDSVIFHDNDFEMFLKPLPESESYYEFEINALNTGWDLFLDKPYSLGGKADNSWEADGLKTAVAVQGTLNHSQDRDRGWAVEIAFPLTAFDTRQRIDPPANGTTWRANFSRVEWFAGRAKEENWVWTSQDVVNMHIPERWGRLIFLR